jgi:hypothetical protein
VGFDSSAARFMRALQSASGITFDLSPRNLLDKNNCKCQVQLQGSQHHGPATSISPIAGGVPVQGLDPVTFTDCTAGRDDNRAGDRFEGRMKTEMRFEKAPRRPVEMSGWLPEIIRAGPRRS